MNDKLIINEIFYSIDGEGSRAGYPSVFVRLAGCNLRCNYCDTEYALNCKAGEELTVQRVVDCVRVYGCRNITLTGGEPLLQDGVNALLRELQAEFDVIIETNGAVDISEAMRYATICMDWKVPSSGMNGKMLRENLSKLRPEDCLKMVVRDKDLLYVKDFLDNNKLSCPVYLSPVFGEASLSEIAQFVKDNNKNNKVRMQIQLHKIIWDPNMKGV